jgi:hypothetical protein
VRPAKDMMEWRRVDNKHDKRAARNDPDEVVLVADYIFPERETILRFDREDLCTEGSEPT